MANKKFEMEWSDEELRCAFNAVVVKNSSIAQRYPRRAECFHRGVSVQLLQREDLDVLVHGLRGQRCYRRADLLRFQRQSIIPVRRGEPLPDGRQPRPFRCGSEGGLAQRPLRGRRRLCALRREHAGLSTKTTQIGGGGIPETVARSLEPPIGDDVPLPNIN